MKEIFGLDKETPKYFTIVFVSNGGSAVEPQKILQDEVISEPAEPVRSDYDFDGWYLDDETFTELWDFSNVPDGNITLYAKWIYTGKLIINPAIIITSPETGTTPAATAAGNGNFTINSILWSPAHGTFLASTQYTVTFTLTADADCTFAGSSAAAVNGYAAEISGNPGDTVTVSYTFGYTNAKAITDIAITAQPVKLTYVHSEQLDLTGLAVTIYHDDSTTEVVPLAGFAANSISASPANNAPLSHTAHDGFPVTVSLGTHTATTSNLIVSQRDISNVTVDAISGYYIYNGGAHEPTPPVTDIVSGVDIITAGDYTETYTNNTNAGTAAVIITPAGNYTGTPLTRNFTINPKALTITGVSAVDRVYDGTNIVTLTGGALQGVEAVDTADVGFTLGTGTVSNGNAAVDRAVMSIAITLTGTAAGNYTLTQPTGIRVTITKDAGAIVAAPTVVSATDSMITISAVTAPAQADGVTAAVVEYARAPSIVPGVAPAVPASGWQTGLNFTGLTAGTEYFVFARSQESTNYNAGTASAGTAISTLGTLTLTLSVVQIENGDPGHNGAAITIYRSGTDGGTPSSTFTVNVANPGLYSSFKWEIDPEGLGAAVTQNSGNSFKLDAATAVYNTIGGHVLRLTVEKDGLQYMVPLLFTVAN